MTSLPQTSLFTEDKSTSLPEGSRVSRTARRAKEKGKTMIVISGLTCYDVFEKSDLAGSWAKTFSGLLLGMPGWYSKRCALTLNLKVTPYSRLFFQLLPSTLHTEETASGLLPTVTCMDSTNATATMKSNQVKEGSMHSVTLSRAMAMGMLPTPQLRDYKGATGVNRNSESVPDAVNRIAGKPSQLSPRFVAEMMGFPTNWTELPFQSGETNQ